MTDEISFSRSDPTRRDNIVQRLIDWGARREDLRAMLWNIWIVGRLFFQKNSI